jgi:2-phospho-L-lactate transferase/gluconeogenesis factor (CofD/UPF0052 family)
MKIKELTQAELTAIATILDELEQQEVEEGFAQADMFNYDNDYIDVELTFGEQTEQYRIDRETMELID